MSRIPNGAVFVRLCHYICETHPIRSIFFLRSVITGHFLDSIVVSESITVERICHRPDRFRSMSFPTPQKIEDDPWVQLQAWIDEGRRFDLICIDPFHTFEDSFSCLTLCVRLLSENGLILCHDCAPPSVAIATPNYRGGEWCGETYAAFIRTAHENREMPSGVLDHDYGIGCLVATTGTILESMGIVGTDHDTVFQREFLEITQWEDRFGFFVEHGEALIRRRKNPKLIRSWFSES